MAPAPQVLKKDQTSKRKKLKNGSEGEAMELEISDGAGVGPGVACESTEEQKKRKAEENGEGEELQESNAISKKKKKKSKKPKEASEKEGERDPNPQRPPASEAVEQSEDKDAENDKQEKSSKKKKKDKEKKKPKSIQDEEIPKPGAEKENSSSKSAEARVPDVSWGAEQKVRAVGDGVTQSWPKPLTGFSDLHSCMDSRLNPALSGFVRPSPIQSWVWPVLLPALARAQQGGEGGARDLVGIAATGSGKTLAFGIPALQHALQHPSKKSGTPSPVVLVLAPTRELAQQISGVLESAAKPCGLGCVCLYGGAPKGPQKAALSRSPAVVVATPGRLEDLMEEGACSLSNVSFAVLDEADRMLDLGFEPHIRAILGQTHKDRRTVMLSATWPTSVAKLALDFLTNPVQVTAGAGEEGASQATGGPSANKNVKQIIEVVEGRAKDQRLLSLLNQYHKSRKNRVLVFVLYKKEAQRVETFLSSRGWTVGALHGDKGQSERMRAVAGFKSGQVPLLVATDVAARGLDIPDVECVINYTFPLTTEDYVHRIGRTGRAGKTGTAHTLFTVAEKGRAGELVNVLREAGQDVPDDLLKFGTTVKKKESKLYGAHFKEITMDSAKPTKVTFADSDEE